MGLVLVGLVLFGFIPPNFFLIPLTFLAITYLYAEPMQNYNPDLTIILTNQDNHTLLIDLGPLHGTYTIARHDESRLLMVSSPISGINKYVCVVEGLEGVSGGSWKGEKDGHDFEGILVRDLIRQVGSFFFGFCCSFTRHASLTLPNIKVNGFPNL